MVLKRVLVTGATGMVGRQVISRLADQNIDVIATSRTRPVIIPSGTSWIPFDLQSHRLESDFKNTFENIDAIVHCAALVPTPNDEFNERDMIDVNIGASQTLAAWALSIGAKLVFISSSSVYADPHQIKITEDSETGPNALSRLYGITKLAAEMVLTSMQQQGLNVSVLRPSSIYGPDLLRVK